MVVDSNLGVKMEAKFLCENSDSFSESDSACVLGNGVGAGFSTVGLSNRVDSINCDRLSFSVLTLLLSLSVLVGVLESVPNISCNNSLWADF